MRRILISLVVLSGVNAFSATRPGAPQDDISSSLKKLGPAVQAALPKARGDVLVVSTPAGLGYQPGLVRYLERRGIPVRVDRSVEDAYGNHRVHRPDAPLRAALTIAAHEDFEEAASAPYLRLVAYWGTRTPGERKTILEHWAELQAAYEAGTLSLDALLHRQAAMPLGSAVGVFINT